MGGLYRRTFFFVSFRKPLAKATREGKGGKEREGGGGEGGGVFGKNKSEPSFSFFPFVISSLSVILHSQDKVYLVIFLVVIIA